MERVIRELQKHLDVLTDVVNQRDASAKAGKEFSEEHTKNYLEIVEEKKEFENAIEHLKQQAMQPQPSFGPGTEPTVILDPDGVLKEPSMSRDAKKGHRVTVTEKTMLNGYQSDRERAAKYLKAGEVYTVEKFEGLNWSSWVTLQEFPGEEFNSVHFIDAK